MPSSTFFRLPAAKRERLLEAARAEFSRTAYGETSINRIIRQAGIPRGSFYMYFHGKDDLFLYMMRAYGERLEQRMGELLEQSGGDLFAAFLALFEHVQAHWQQEQYQDLARMLRLNGNLKPDIFLCSTGEAIARPAAGQDRPVCPESEGGGRSGRHPGSAGDGNRRGDHERRLRRRTSRTGTAGPFL